MNRLPIGIQSFEEIRRGYIYVDKTECIHDLVNSGKYLFLSRPRRFGKSLLVDTLRCLFEGKKGLFEGLWIYDKWDWEKSYPVIKIDMGMFDSKDIDEFSISLKNFFKIIYKRFGMIESYEKELSPKDLMGNLVLGLYNKYDTQVVILLDEYDKPIIDNIEREEYAVEIRDYLRSFYEVFKGLDRYIKLFFMTGVSKFSRVSLFSGLNNLEDISLYPQYGTLLGYTDDEITLYFKDYLDNVDREVMRYWYNGYNFLGRDRVYNPFDVLQFLKAKKYQNYWFRTGTPSFLIKVLRQRDGEPDIAGMENVELSADMLDTFDVYTMPFETLLWQTGYLTIEEEIEDIAGVYYRLGIPNYEVRISLNREFLFSYLNAVGPEDITDYGRKVRKAVEEEDVEGFIEVIRALFAGIPYSSVPLARYEDYYKSVMYAFLMGAGFEVIVEDITDRGRIDLTVRLPVIYKRESPVFMIELKVVDKREGSALRQIKEMGYYEKYRCYPSCFFIGMEFDRGSKEFVYVEWEACG